MTFCWLTAEHIPTLEMTFQGIFQPPKGSNMELKVMSVNSHPSFETSISIVVIKFLNVEKIIYAMRTSRDQVSGWEKRVENQLLIDCMTSSKKMGAVTLVGYGCEMVSHCGFNLQFAFT